MADRYHDAQGRTFQQCVEEAAEKYSCEIRVIRKCVTGLFTVHISGWTGHANDMGTSRTAENPFQALAEALVASRDPMFIGRKQ